MARDSTQRLGRGLAALLGDDGPSATPNQGDSGTIRAIALDRLYPSPFQPRQQIEPAALEELTASITAQGILQPLLVRPDPGKPGCYQIIAGERRWRAARAAGLSEAPVLIRDLADNAAMAASLVENLQRQDLNAIEEAEGYRRLLVDFSLTQEQLGAAVGKSRSHIANAVRLLQLPETVRGEVRNGALSAGHARALLAHPDPAKAALAVIAHGLNVRQTEALSASGAGPAPADGKAIDPEIVALERDMSERLGLRVQIIHGSVRGSTGGSVRISYRTLDQLDGIVALLSRD